MLHDWQQDFARCLRDPAAVPALASAHEARFAIYRDSVVGSLVAALGDAFPVARLMLGDRFFDAAAAGYVRQEPPQAALLSSYGEGFPAHLQSMSVLDDLPYIADVARLEWARIESYFAGAAESAVTADMLLQLPTTDLPFLRFQPAPGLRLVGAPTAIWSIWTAHQETPPRLDGLDPWQPQAVRLLCDRRHVAMQSVSPGQFRFLGALMAGSSLIEAMEAAQAVEPSFDLQAALSEELRQGSFVALQSGNGDAA